MDHRNMLTTTIDHSQRDCLGSSHHQKEGPGIEGVGMGMARGAFPQL